MTIYFFENPNGKFISTDGNRRFVRFVGKDAYKYIKAHDFKETRFFKFEDDDGNTIKIELPPKNVGEYRKQERREQYIRETMEENAIVLLSMDSPVASSEDELTLVETIADEDTDVVQEVLHQMDLQTLRRALHSLQPKETAILYALYLCDNPMSERKYAASIGVPQKTLNDRKQAILDKLKKFF